MLGALVFAASFMLLFILTMMFPGVPPGKMICDVFGNSETVYSLADVSGELILASVTNGLIWGAITVIFYSYLRGPSKGKISLPVWLPGYAASHNSKTENKSTKQQDKPSFREIRRTQDFESIEGIGYIYAFRLKKLEINTVDDLIQVASTKSGQNHLAGMIGVTPSTVRNWIRQAETLKGHKIS
jgi:predicted flap endonuclease-1-like 5' DNA nuclease